MSQIDAILRSCHTIAVVGLSGRRFRPSYGVAEYMQKAGYRIIPVNPTESQVLGEKCYPDLESIPEAVDIVDIFRLKRIMRQIPAEGAMRYHRWSREDVEELDAAQTALLIEMGRLHRGDGAIPIETAIERVGGPDPEPAGTARTAERRRSG